MPRRNSPHVRRFHLVALQRFEDAEILLQNGRTNGAMYLGGYTVECMLKALLLSSVPVGSQNALMKSFRGSIAHNYDWLRNELRAKGIEFPAIVARQLLIVNSWSTELRYLAGTKKAREVQVFLNAAAQLLEWVERKL